MGADPHSPDACVCKVEPPVTSGAFKTPPAPATTTAAAPPAVATSGKVCHRCGKDVAGQRRFKDDEGYLCAECMEKEDAQSNEVRCSHCSRKFPPDKLLPFTELKLCLTCYRANMKDTEKKLKKLGGQRLQVQHERATLWKLAAVVGVLLLLILLNRIGWL
jgi:hypothetical protein